jgi:hypothetical protein
MNYYAQGGQPYGINTLRSDDYYSRGVQYKDGVPAFGIGGALKKAWKGTVGKAEDLAKPITKPITDAIKPILPYVQYIAPFIPGVGPLAAAGLGALGSGFAQGGGFNFKRGLMGGMTAYGLSNLYAGVQAAGGASPGSTIPSTDIAAANLTPDPIASLNQSQGFTGVGEAELLNSTATPPSFGSQVMSGDFSGAIDTAGTNISNAGTNFNTQMSNAGQGIKNLTGLGETTMTSGDALKAAGSQFGSGSASAIYGGVTGGMALDEMETQKLQADLANAKSQDEYNEIMGRIEASKQRGIAAMRANPYQFAYGGSVDDEVGFDNFNNYMSGGIASMAKGGMAPKFLSGGGDGMSDDIPATINGKQPARLADGEFVIPADVVSHLGNGSSKAGAKQLYSMMDKVRTARTGNKKQGKQINPNKFLLA